MRFFPRVRACDIERFKEFLRSLGRRVRIKRAGKTGYRVLSVDRIARDILITSTSVPATTTIHDLAAASKRNSSLSLVSLEKDVNVRRRRRRRRRGRRSTNNNIDWIAFRVAEAVAAASKLREAK